MRWREAPNRGSSKANPPSWLARSKKLIDNNLQENYASEEVLSF